MTVEFHHGALCDDYEKQANAQASLPPAAAEAARQIGWRNLCMSENQAADRAHFQKVYEIAAERQTEKALLPKSLLELIAQKQIGALEKKEEQNDNTQM